jgi:predicted RNase H-like HicB family nuclease
MAARFTGIYEKGEKFYIGYCPEVPGANGQGETVEECRESLKEAIKLILQDRLEEALPGIPDDAIRETVVIE